MGGKEGNGRKPPLKEKVIDCREAAMEGESGLDWKVAPMPALEGESGLDWKVAVTDGGDWNESTEWRK